MAPYVAKPFVAGTPEAIVIGQTMLAFLENIQVDSLRPILEKHNATDIDPEKWYPHQTWMDILRDVQDSLDEGEASVTFVAFGRKVVEAAVMPPEIKTIPDVLHALQAIHHANLRNIPEEEGYIIEERGEKNYVVYHNTPNPDDAIYGFLWGLAARFKQPQERFIVEMIENDRPDIARSAFSVRWGESDDL